MVAGRGGPFTGKGWGEQKQWLQDAKRGPSKKVTPQRAKQIIQQARSKSKSGPWSDAIVRVTPQGEYRYIYDHWQTMKGTANFVDALLAISKGDKKANDAMGQRVVTRYAASVPPVYKGS